MEEEEQEQSTMAIALSLATEINECCESMEEVKEIFARLNEILKVRFGSEFHVLFQDSHK